ncbi:hypothetical protein KP509_17G072600 [Ceratopteris richardii]|uniref:Uncharacterized protein n=2 Tax=Ceratopteris richardii TaxID=49495 RepID=A0A8T2SX86_CERRI|nr:hypothetical protein KP509_17G072600 [Ceratopteris richardii]
MSEGEEGNTYLPITHQGYTTNAILDSGARIAIATTSLWKRWGKPALRPTRMKLQMADGHIERPLGLLEGITLTTCGVEFEHTFAICDFSKNHAYEMILGRPFMRQLQVVQDWGTNSLYLQHLGVTTKVNLKDYSHRDVPPIQWNPLHRAKDDTESVHSIGSGSSWMHEDTHLWMCKVAVEEEKREEAREIGAKETHRSIQDPTYAPVVFPDEEFEPHGWAEILATMDVAINEEQWTPHCDEDGYDISVFSIEPIMGEAVLEECEPSPDAFEDASDSNLESIIMDPPLHQMKNTSMK